VTAYITLKEAVERWRAVTGYANSYQWYRKHAPTGWVSFGGCQVPVVKQSGRWLLEDSAIDVAVNAHRAAEAKVEQVTLDYANHVLHGEPGHTERTTWGGYTVNRGFHFAWNDYDVARMRSDGSWYCSSCWGVASTEHEKDECHTCSDWGGCGRDCTLSAVKCARCETRLSL
jgi:hypothetical protein